MSSIIAEKPFVYFEVNSSGEYTVNIIVNLPAGSGIDSTSTSQTGDTTRVNVTIDPDSSSEDRVLCEIVELTKPAGGKFVETYTITNTGVLLGKNRHNWGDADGDEA